MSRLDPHRTSKALQVVGVACALLAVVLLVAPPAASDEAAPTELGSYALQAAAHGARVELDPNAVGTVPDSFATLDTGNIAYGRASVAWPGPLGANAGDLIILASGGQVPPEMEPTFRALNYPVRAEARAPGGPAESSFDESPGLTMVANASEAHADALAEAERTAIPGLGTLGTSTTTARTELVDGSARSTSLSAVSGIELADGLLEIETVTSRADASSDGAAAEGTAETTVSGVTVAGTPATLDENGLTIGAGEPSNPVNEVANEVASQALQQSGMRIVVTEPIIEQEGASATAIAGSVLIAMSDEGPFIVLGGASASSVAGEAFAFEMPDLVTDAAPPAPSDLDVGSSGSTSAGTPPPASPSAGSPPTEAAAPSSVQAAPIVSDSGPELPDAEFAGVLAAGAALAFLTARAMRRLGTAVDLAAGCPRTGAS